MGRSLSSYVGVAAGGSQKATKKMGSSRTVAGGLLGLIRDLDNLGPGEALRKFHLDDLAGKPADHVLLRLGELISPPGGSIDEGIARNALVEAIAELAEVGLQNFDQLSEAQMIFLLEAFICRSIEARVVNDIGMKAVYLPVSTMEALKIQQQLHDFIKGCVSDALVGKLGNVRELTDHEVQTTIEKIYEASFGLLEAFSEDHETE